MLSGTNWTLQIGDDPPICINRFETLERGSPTKNILRAEAAIDEIRTLVRKTIEPVESVILEKNRVNYKINEIVIHRVGGDYIEWQFSEVDRTLPVDLEEVPKKHPRLPEQKLDWVRLGF